MQNYLVQLLAKFPKIFWGIIGSSLGAFIIIVGVGVASVLMKTSNLSYESGETKINLGAVKKATNDNEYASKKLQDKINSLEEELSKLKSDRDIEPIKKTLEELKPTANEVVKSSEELNKLIDDTE